MANAIKWIATEAKKLRRKYPRRFKTWREYVAEASAIYAKKHKGKSPIGKKKKARRRIGVAEGHKKGKPVPGITIFHPMHSVGRAKKRKARRRKVGTRGPITYRFIRKPGQRLKPAIGSRRKSTRKRSSPAFLDSIAWYIVQRNEMGFEKRGKNYYTVGPSRRRIVWQDWEADTAKAWLKKHCLKSK